MRLRELYSALEEQSGEQRLVSVEHVLKLAREHRDVVVEVSYGGKPALRFMAGGHSFVVAATDETGSWTSVSGPWDIAIPRGALEELRRRGLREKKNIRMRLIPVSKLPDWMNWLRGN